MVGNPPLVKICIMPEITIEAAQWLPYILGLDIGARSIGWAIIDIRHGKPAGIRRAGVRCFDAGVEGSIEQGKDASRAAQRRQARLARRQTWRRARRARKVFGLLQSLNLLPAGDGGNPQERHRLLYELDRELLERHGCLAEPVKAHLLPYILRAFAAEQPIERFEFGRALYHLAQRRGYLSNRKAEERGDDEDDQGKVKAGIESLATKLAGRTLGQYFATLDPRDERIRRRWTSRQMYLDEFNRIWSVQAPLLGLKEEEQKRLYDAIFFQRPLKSQKGLVGKCELERGRRRAPLATLAAQEFRILQKVIDLRVRFPDAAERPLTSDERQTLIDALQESDDLSCAAARKLLKLNKRGIEFSIEEWGEKKLPGNRTNAGLAAIFGKRWPKFTSEERDQIILEVLHYQKPAALVRRAMKHWGLDREAAEKLSELRLEAGHARHSIPALKKLNDLMRHGIPYSTARKEAYPRSFTAGKPLKLLPPVMKACPDLRNPAVCRTLTELRKVVNAIIRQYGKPETIRIELARDLKRSRKDRKRIADAQREQEARRSKALSKMLGEFSSYQPKAGFDPAIEKILLAEECNWQCPFTGRTIHMQALVGRNAQFDVAHLFPRRYLDNSFLNKTLCYHDENRHRMHDLLPKQAYGGDADRWKEIVQRVKAFKGPAAAIKLERFQAEEVPEDFVERQLNDTRHNSMVAAEYLGLLYGGLWDPAGKRRIEAVAGGITAMLRNAWRLRKDRNDHRHHAQDAIVLALTGPAQVKLLQESVARASEGGQRFRLGDLDDPWPNFCGTVSAALDAINVSFRCNRKLAGALHAGTNYSQPIKGGNGPPVHHVRKELHKLSLTEISGDAIVDRAIRTLVQQKFQELGGKDPKKVFADPANHPAMLTKDGRKIPVHKARLRVGDKPKAIAERGMRQRFVTAGANSNHHCAIVALLDLSGKETKWEERIVDRLEANRRQARSRKDGSTGIIQRDWGRECRFKFSLMPNDMLTLEDEGGVRRLYRLCNISKGDYELRLHSDAREATEIRKLKQRIRVNANDLRKARARKVVVGPLGDVVDAHD